MRCPVIKGSVAGGPFIAFQSSKLCSQDAWNAGEIVAGFYVLPFSFRHSQHRVQAPETQFYNQQPTRFQDLRGLAEKSGIDLVAQGTAEQGEFGLIVAYLALQAIAMIK